MLFAVSARTDMADERSWLQSVRLHRTPMPYNVNNRYVSPGVSCACMQEAAALFAESARANAADERSWLQSGLLQRRQGNTAGARECFRRASEAAPRTAYIWQVCILAQ